MLGGLWNGAYFLAEAGLLDGYDCAFHPDGRSMMTELFPRVRLSRHSFVLDRERIACAGASSSLDMMLAVVKRDPTLPQPLKLALELMHNNIDEPLKMDEIAACAEISVRQLERQFCRHVNATPSRYYLELRLTRARQLLQQTNKSLADIAVACGFVSISHFRRCFREFFDIAPGCFRAGVRKG